MSSIEFGKPRHNCQEYVLRNGGKAELLERVDFDNLVDEGLFTDGPFADGFGAGHGEPYYPWTQAYGTLNTGKVVFTELHPSTN